MKLDFFLLTGNGVRSEDEESLLKKSSFVPPIGLVALRGRTKGDEASSELRAHIVIRMNK
jgi:hypothetical protein